MQFFKNEKNSFRKNALNHLSRDIETGFNAFPEFRPNLKKTKKKTISEENDCYSSILFTFK